MRFEPPRILAFTFGEGKQGVAGEVWYFLRTNKRWWLTPLLLVLLLLGAIIVLGGTGAAPFIYTLF